MAISGLFMGGIEVRENSMHVTTFVGYGTEEHKIRAVLEWSNDSHVLEALDLIRHVLCDASNAWVPNGDNDKQSEGADYDQEQQVEVLLRVGFHHHLYQ